MLTPLAVGPGQPFPYISGLSLSLGVFVRQPETGEERFARVKVPEGLPRFLELGERGLRMPLEHVIAHHLSSLFPQMEIVECAAFRVTRDADYEVSDEADDLLEAVEIELRRRRFGEPVRLEVSDAMSSRMLDRLQTGLRRDAASRSTACAARSTSPTRSSSRRSSAPTCATRCGSAGRRTASRAGSTRAPSSRRSARGDLLVHHPYDSFATTFEAFLRAAAEDPDVTAIKTTVYRTSDDSPLVPRSSPRPRRASRACASSSCRRASTSTATSAGRARSSARACTSSTGSRT